MSEAQAHRDVQTILQRVNAVTEHTAEEYIALECERLDMALAAIAGKVKAGHLGAIPLWIRLSESRRKRLSLNAPDLLRLLDGMSDEEIRAMANGGSVGPRLRIYSKIVRQ